MPTVDIFAEVDVTKPTPERRAAKQAAERLTQLTRSIGVQAITTPTPPRSSVHVHVDEVKGDEAAADTSVNVSSRGGGGENFEEEFGFSHEVMLSFKAKIDQEKSMKCPIEVHIMIIMYMYVL
jgi:phenylpyruvate tautomerase PptA (4-oxalocrotonate tautomerase family)